jgi:hypothetical protein
MTNIPRNILSSGVGAFFLLGVAFSSSNAQAIELLLNGNFETGSFSGWTVNDLLGSSGSFFVDAPGTTTPLSSHSTIGSVANGNFYAVTDQTGPGTHALRQSFTVGAGTSSVVLSFDLFANDYDSGPIINPAGLTHTAGANQHARVDILTASAGAFDVGSSVLSTYYLGVDAGADPHPFTHYSFDITSLVGAGGTFQLRFAEVDNQGHFNLGVDNASIQASGVPDSASSASLLILSLASIVFIHRRIIG